MHDLFSVFESPFHRRIRLARMCSLLMVLAVIPTHPAQGQDAPTTECDRLAADPDDGQRIAPGVPVWRLSGEAKKACYEAVDAYPNVARLQHQLGRALQRWGESEEAREWFLKAAEQGYAPAQSALAFLYWTGAFRQDLETVLVWFQRAAENDHAPAQYHLGSMYRSGEGVEEDHEKAKVWHSRAAEQGHVLAQAELAVHHGDSEAALKACDGLAADPADDERTAPGVSWAALMSETTSSLVIEACRTAVTNHPGIPRLQYQLGRSLQKTFAHEEAGRWLRKAAEQGYAAAQWFVGVRYANGTGVPQDFHQAAAWFRRAAEQGNATAQYDLATFFYKGKGVEQSYDQAATWCQRAAEQGEIRGQNCLGVLYQMGLGVKRDYEQAAMWYERAAEQGDSDAQTNLGIVYEKGWGVPRDYEKAVALYRQGAAYRPPVARASDGTVNKRAQAHLGYAYYQGRGIAKDVEEAYELLSQAGTGANAFPWATVDALIMEANGIGTRQDILAAYQGFESLLEPSPYDPSPFNAAVANFAARYLRENPWLEERAEKQLENVHGSATQRAESTGQGVGIGAVLGGLVILGALLGDGESSESSMDDDWLERYQREAAEMDAFRTQVAEGLMFP